MTPEDQRRLEHEMAEHEVTKLIGILSVLRPDLVEKFRDSPETLREQAWLSMREVYGRPEPVPDVFRRAFEGE